MQNEGSSARPTLRDVAKAAGVHPSTVSLALRNDPRISKETGKRVREVALELGYRPNAFVAQLMRYRRRRVSASGLPVIVYLITHESRDVLQQHEYLRRFREGARAAVEGSGYAFEEVFLGETGGDIRRMGKVLSYRGIRGLLIAPLGASFLPDDFPWEKFNAVLLGSSLSSPAFDRARPNYYRNVELAIDQCLKKDLRRIGFYVPAENSRRLGLRALAAFLRAQFVAEISPSIPPASRMAWRGKHLSGG